MKKAIDDLQIIHDKLQDELIQKCVCGHSLPFGIKQPYKICTWCGRKVINNTKARFIYCYNQARSKKGYKVIKLEPGEKPKRISYKRHGRKKYVSVYRNGEIESGKE